MSLPRVPLAPDARFTCFCTIARCPVPGWSGAASPCTSPQVIGGNVALARPHRTPSIERQGQLRPACAGGLTLQWPHRCSAGGSATG